LVDCNPVKDLNISTATVSDSVGLIKIIILIEKKFKEFNN
jgi:hypothetical protein